MRHCDRRHGQDGHEILDLPVVGHEWCNSEDDHSGDTDDGEQHGELELLEHLGHFNEEVGEFGFLGGGTPRHVDLEHVAQESLGDMQGETTQEDCEHEGPLHVLEERVQEGAFTDTVAHDCQSDVAETIENNDDGEPDLPRIDVVFIEVTVVPSDGEVVGCGHDPGGTDGIVGSDI